MSKFNLETLLDTEKCHNAMMELSVSKTYRDILKDLGIRYLGDVDVSVKAIHSSQYGTRTYFTYLLPADGALEYINEDGVVVPINVCPNSFYCKASCLAESGQARIDRSGKVKKNIIYRARLLKTKLLFERPDIYLKLLDYELQIHSHEAQLDGYGFAARLNTTSDIDWRHIKVGRDDYFNVIDSYKDIQFYDYTKVPSRLNLGKKSDGHYFLTLSYNGYNENICTEALNQGYGVAVVFYDKLPDTYWGKKVINGDLFDMRYYDKEFFGIPENEGYIVGLKYKKVLNDFVNGKFQAPSEENMFIVRI